MRLRILALIGLAAFAAGCDDMQTNGPIPDVTDERTDIPPTVDPDPTLPPDNSGVNERDRDGVEKTPFDQGQNSADVERTAEIRRKVLELDDISINARNVKIITENGHVTLRGPVASEAEKEAIYRAAVEVAGEENVVNELEVSDPNP
jgi:hyperosmotically inducible protein